MQEDDPKKMEFDNLETTTPSANKTFCALLRSLDAFLKDAIWTYVRPRAGYRRLYLILSSLTYVMYSASWSYTTMSQPYTPFVSRFPGPLESSHNGGWWSPSLKWMEKSLVSMHLQTVVQATVHETALILISYVSLIAESILIRFAHDT